jgi:molecular chaperone DnaJ
VTAQREWFEKDYYKVLGVSESASQKEITKRLPQARPRAAPRRQPRRRQGRGALQGGVGGLRGVGDAEKRKEYDEVRRLGPDGRRHGRRARRVHLHHRRPRRPLRRTCSTVGGRSAPAAAGRVPGPGPQRGPDLEAELHLSFVDAVKHGVTTEVHLTSDAACSTCARHRRQARHRSPPARAAAAGACSTRTRASSRSASRAPCGARAGRRRSVRRPAAAAASSAGPARSRCASRPASTTASASA